MRPPNLLFAGMMLLMIGTAEGGEHRSSGMVLAFKHNNPCPATGKIERSCKGYVVDHKYPLCAGGKDELANRQWQEYKQSLVKDRIEKELCNIKNKKGC